MPGLWYFGEVPMTFTTVPHIMPVFPGCQIVLNFHTILRISGGATLHPNIMNKLLPLHPYLPVFPDCQIVLSFHTILRISGGATLHPNIMG